MWESTEQNAAKARGILEAKIESGRASAVALFDRVEREVPRDSIVRGSAMVFDSRNGLEVALRSTPGAEAEGAGLKVHEHALSQMAARACIPPQYLAGLAAEQGWQADLAAHILSRHYTWGLPRAKYLIREVGGQVRGFLSDRFRRLDSRPLLEAFAKECMTVGAVPVDGIVSDTRVALRAIVPQVFEPVEGDPVAFGVQWANSDYGNCTHAVRAFILRVACLNGATTENVLSQVHLGRQLSEEFDMSEKTYRLDTMASISALQDVVRGVLSAPKIDEMCLAVRSAAESSIEWKGLKGNLGRRLLKHELEKVKDAFEGDDVVSLPPGRTMWRASNALSWIAGKSESPDRRLELERMAGELVSCTRDRATSEAA